MVEALSLFSISCTESSQSILRRRKGKSRFIFILWNAAALSLAISTPSVPWLYSWQTNASASVKTLSSCGQCSPICSMSFDEVSKIFKAHCLPIAANCLVLSQPSMVWKASSDFLFSSGNEILWTGIYLLIIILVTGTNNYYPLFPALHISSFTLALSSLPLCSGNSLDRIWKVSLENHIYGGPEHQRTTKNIPF